MNSFGLHSSIVLCILSHMHMCYVWCVWEKEMTHMGSISNAFFYAISINQIPSKIYFISKVAITLLHWWHNHLYSLPFSLSTSISPSLSLSTMLPHQFLGANAKSQSGVSVSCSYLTNTNPDSLPVFVSVFVKSPMLEMPVKKQNWTRWCFASAWLAWPPLPAVSFATEISVVLTYSAESLHQEGSWLSKHSEV